MKAMIKSLAVLLLAIIPFVSSAQNSKLFRETRVIHELQINDGQADYEVISLPENDQRENVIITHVKPLLQHQYEFKIRRESHIRATYVARSDFGSIVSGVKFYRKIHPKEQ